MLTHLKPFSQGYWLSEGWRIVILYKNHFDKKFLCHITVTKPPDSLCNVIVIYHLLTHIKIGQNGHFIENHTLRLITFILCTLGRESTSISFYCSLSVTSWKSSWRSYWIGREMKPTLLYLFMFTDLKMLTVPYINILKVYNFCFLRYSVSFLSSVFLPIHGSTDRWKLSSWLSNFCPLCTKVFRLQFL